jgi:UDP-3-O-[3-hydroxymyristoyl] glucosamine N-acyltransferase
MKLHEIARRTQAKLEGDGEIEIDGISGIEEAGPGQITFLSNTRYRSLLKKTRAGAIILKPGEEAPPRCNVLRSSNPYLAFARTLDLFHRRKAPPAGVHPSAAVDPAARLGRDVAVGPHAVIEAGAEVGERTEIGPNVTVQRGARIGEACVIHASAVVRENVSLGNRVVLQNGAVIGSDGFGFAPTEEGRYHKLCPAGTVILEDDVEIGANTTVDRATVGATVIRRGTKLDNLVHVGHGCEVGEDTVMAAGCGLAGGTKVGSHVMMGGQSASSGHLTIGDRAQCAARTAIHTSVPEGAVIGGAPQLPIQVWMKASAALKHLPGALRRLRRIEKKLGLREPPGER